MTIPRMTPSYKAANPSAAVILLRETLRRAAQRGELAQPTKH